MDSLPAAADILRDRLDAALGQLGAAKPAGSNIHSARKDIKRSRAVLRAMRKEMDEARFRKTEATIRHAAHLLNEARDAEVLLQVFLKIRKATKRWSPTVQLGSLHRTLLAERRRSAAQIDGDTLKQIQSLLARARRQVRVPENPDENAALQKGMRNTYRKARDGYRQARKSPTADCLHAWRRQVKYCIYQIEAVVPDAPPALEQWRKQSKKLAELLGDDHDLSLLRSRLQDAALDSTSASSIAITINHVRMQLQREVLGLGGRLFEDKPREFQKQLRRGRH